MRKLEELLAPRADAVGYRLGWAAAAGERIREVVPPTLTDVELSALDVEQLLTCPGLKLRQDCESRAHRLARSIRARMRSSPSCSQRFITE